MNRVFIKFFVFLSIALFPGILSAQDIKKALRDAEKQLSFFYDNVVKERDGKKIFPRSIRNDSLKLVASNDWTSGFFPGMLWYMYEYTGKNEWRTKAEEFTSLMERETKNAGSHDVGFKVFNSYVSEYFSEESRRYKIICPVIVFKNAFVTCKNDPAF